MKKLTFILAFGAMLALTACGSGSTTTESKDSTMAPVADTTAAPTQGGAGGGVMDSPSDSKEQLPQTDEVK